MSGLESKTVINKVLKRIGKKCRFTFPEILEGKRRKLEGVLLDRYAMYRPAPGDEHGATDYVDVIDLIEFQEGNNKITVVRFGYYRKTMSGKWIWGSQTTLSERIETLKKFFKEASENKNWFREILEQSLKH